MATSSRFAILCFILCSLSVSSSAQTCRSYAFSNSRRFSLCTDLGRLNAFLHWTYNQSAGTVDIAYRHTGTNTSRWSAWALNPSGRAMEGSQALVAFVNSSGTVQAYTTSVDSMAPSMKQSNLSFPVSNLQATFANGEMSIFARLTLSQSLLSTNQVWQEGPVSNGQPRIHPTTGDNVNSVGVVNFQTRETAASGGDGNSSARNCRSYAFSNSRQFSSCNDLGRLNAFLHWTYNQSAGTVDIAYRHTGTTSSRWSAWALNPSGRAMEGSQALVAFVNSSGAVQAYTTSVDSMTPSMRPSNLSFRVSNLLATFVNGEMTIFARLTLSQSLLSTNQVWQEGPVSNDQPRIHPTTGDNVNSVGTVNFQTGETAASGGAGNSRNRKRNVHGVLNAVSWGILLPVGVMTARYLKVFKVANPAWFYLHAACQSSAYIIGVAGWGTGLKLGSDSPGITYKAHRTIGIILFCLGTLQVFALLLRPKPDHKYRFYWNIYHHSIGYVVIVLSIVNIFKGFDALDREKNWKKAYIGILIFLGATAAFLEALTWIIVLKRKKEGSDKLSHSINGANGANGANGYGNRTNHGV